MSSRYNEKITNLEKKNAKSIELIVKRLVFELNVFKIDNQNQEMHIHSNFVPIFGLVGGPLRIHYVDPYNLGFSTGSRYL